MHAYTYPEAHAPRGLGAFSVLCVYAGANEGGVRLALLQGHTVVFRGEGFDYQVRFNSAGDSQQADSSSPSAGTSSGSPLTSSSGGRETASSRDGRRGGSPRGVWFGNSRGRSGSLPSGSWAISDDASSGGPGSSRGAGLSGELTPRPGGREAGGAGT